jgi:serine/threonine protein kinase/tetratricopeptide (TPR) repeat protein
MNAEEIFHDALARPFAERPAFLAAACAGDEALRRRVEALLHAHDNPGSFLAEQAPLPTATVDEPGLVRPEMIIGSYKLLEQIGEGGMGTVWMAQQTEPVKRVVALKLIKAGMDSKQVIARFEAERQALALMDHPNIARVLDAGTTKGEPGGVSPGRPYFVMDLVKGVPITKYCDEHRFTPRQRLELFIPVCQAVQHAHQKGIIHRDLKPSNVLVAHYDGRPVPKVIDFGVAKAAGQSLTDKTLVTGFGAIIGTLEYMSPEQAEVNQIDIDTRSDIYSLGVLLYELLTGSPPFTKKELEKAGMLEMLRVIREKEPSKPSTKLSTAEGLPTLAANRGTEPAKLTRLVRGELDWIVMKALDKDRNRRYETAKDVVADVQRYLNDEPVQACPPSAWYRFRKMARRNKAAMTVAVMFTLALFIAVAALSISTVLTSRAYAAEKEAHRQSEADFQRTRAAVDEFFTTVSQSKLLDVPGVQPVRKQLLESAVRYYQALAKERDDDPTIQADLALAHLRLAGVYYEVGDNNKAIASVDACLDLAEQLIQDHPDNPDLLRRLAGFWKGTRRMRDSNPGPTDLVAAERSMNRFIRIWQTLSDKDPSERAFRSDLAAAYHRFGQLLDVAQRRPEAVVAAEKAAGMWETLIRDYPKEPEYLSAQGDTYTFLRFVARVTGQRQRESEYARKAVEIAEKLAVMNPTAPPYRDDIARGIMIQASALRAQEKPAEAERQYRRALAIWEKLANEYPTNARYHAQLLATWSHLTELLKSMGQTDEAERFRLRFAEILDKAIVVLPAEPLRALAEETSDLGHLWHDNGHSAEAATLFRAAAKFWQKLATDDPMNLSWRMQLGDAYRMAGHAHSGPEREQFFREALNVFERLAADSHDAPEYRRWVGHVHLALALAGLNQPKKSEQSFRKAFEILAILPADILSEHFARLDVKYAITNLVNLLKTGGRHQEAEKVLRQAIELYEKLAAACPNDAGFKKELQLLRREAEQVPGVKEKKK